MITVTRIGQREIAADATAATDARWAQDVADLSYDEVRAKAKEERGEASTRRLGFELPL